MKNKLFSVLVVLMLLIVTGGVILSCTQSLPSQYEVTVKVLDSDSVQRRSDNAAVSDDDMWIDYDEVKGSEKTTVFAGGKFARSIDSQRFTIRTDEQYWTFIFDGLTYSRDQLTYDMIEQGVSQSIFDGRIDGSNVTLYAKYTVEKRERSALELLGTVTGTKYVSIPDDDPEEFELCLNGDYTFTEDPQYDLAFKVGAAIPDDWTFTKVSDLHYTIASLDESRKVLKINVTGIPKVTEALIGELVIPKEYISVQRGNQTENPIVDVPVDTTGASYIINASSANANKTLEIVGNQYDDFNSSPREIVISLENAAIFDDSRFIIGEELKVEDFTVYPRISGLKYYYKELRSGGTELVIGIGGVPLVVSNSTISISFKEKFIKNSEENAEDLILVKTSGLKYNIGYVTISASTQNERQNADGNTEYLINGVWEINIPENSAEVISLKITSSATFENATNSQYKGGDDVPDSWFNGTKVPGFAYKFGTISDKEITINITSAPTYDSTFTVPDKVDLRIPVSMLSGVSESDISITPSGTIRYNITRPSISFSASSLGSRRYPLTIVKNVSLGGGNGAELTLQLSDGVEFESSLFTMASDALNNEIKTWFADFETKLGSKDKFTYTVKNISSKDVVIAINGVTSYSAMVSNETVNITVPAKHIKNAGAALTTLNASLIYNTTSVQLGLSNEENYYGYGPDNEAIQANITDDSLPENTLVKVMLYNAEFSETLTSEKIKKWFDGFAAVSSNFSYEPIGTPGVDEDGNGYQIVKIIGNVDKITDANIGVNTVYKLIISPDDIKGGAIASWPSYDTDSALQTSIYVKVEGQVSIELEEGEFFGSSTNPLVGKKSVPMNNEQGYNIRINLIGGTFKNVTVDAINTWFDAVSFVIKKDSISIVEGGKDGDNYVIVNYKGSIQNLTSSNGRSARISVRKDNISLAGLSYDPTVSLFYVCEEEISASVYNKLPYYGSELYPISGTRYMPLNNGSGVEIRVVLNGTKFSKEITQIGLGDWFSDFKDIDTPTYQIVEGGKSGDNFIVIRVLGALNTATTGTLSFSLKLDASKIKGAEDKKNITATVYYTISDEPRVVLVDEGTSYFGTETNPLSSVNYTTFSSTVKLELLGGAKFSNIIAEGQSIATWFKNFKEIINATYEILTKTETTVTVKVTGALSVDRSSHEGEDLYSATIEIPTTAITGSLSSSLKTQIYYRASGDVNITFDPSVRYVGSKENPLVGVKNVSINTDPTSTKPKTILARLIVENGTFNKLQKSDVENWFRDFNDLKDANFDIIENEAGKDYITISIEGTLTTSSKTPVSVPLYVLGNALKDYVGDGGIVVPFYYNISNDISASLAEGGDYFGTVSAPFIGTRYGYLQKTLRIDLDGGVFSSTLTADDICDWFKDITGIKGEVDTITGERKLEVNLMDGGTADSSYVIFTLRALISSDGEGIQNEYITIDKKVIKNATGDDVIRIPFYYGADKEVSLSLDESDLYFGATQSRAISGVPGQIIGNDNKGISIKINIENGYFTKKTDGSFTSDEIAEWFRDFNNFEPLQGSSNGNPFSVLDFSSLSSSSLIINIYGALKTGVENEGTFKIHIPSKYITGEQPSELDATVYYSVSGEMSLNIDDRGEYYGYFGSESAPLEGNKGIELANFDGSPLRVRVNVSNGKFASTLKVGDSVDSWFTNLASKMVNSSFTINQIGTNRDYVVVNVNGALVETGLVSRTEKVELTIPSSAFDGQYIDTDIHNPEIAYQISMEVGAKVIGLGTASKPIIRTIYQTFDDVDNPTLLSLQLDYFDSIFEQGENVVTFANSITTGTDVTSWFVNWIGNGISENVKFTVVEGGDGTDYVKIKIENGALISEPPQDNMPLSTTIVIPPSAINGYLTENIELKNELFYQTTDKITASISGGIEYSGGNSETNPVSETQNMLLGKGEGVLVRVELDDNTFKFKANAGLLVNGPVTWLNSQEGINDKIKNLNVTLVSGGPGFSYAILRIKGAITTPVNEIQEAVFTIPSRQIDGYLEYTSDDGARNSNISGTLYFRSTSAPSVSIENTSPYKGGSLNNAINGTRYVALGDGNGQEIYIKLTNAVFSDTLTDVNVAAWFKTLTDSMINPEVTIVQGGKKQSYVIALLKGYLTQSAVSTGVSLTIPASDLYNNSSDRQLTAPLYYRVNGVVSASLGNAPYYGTNENPIMDIRGVELQRGDGVLIRIELTNGVFKDTITEGKSVSGWFTSFADLTNPSYEVIDGGNGKNYVIIRVKGIISDAVTQGNTNYSTKVTIPADAIEGVLTEGPSLDLYYNVEDTVKVSLNTSVDYYGSVNNPIVGTRYIALNTGEGYNVRIDLTNGKFINNMVTDVSDWFKSFTDLIGDNDTERSMQVIDGGDGQNYVVINVKGALASPVEGTGASSVAITVPRSVIVGFLENDTDIDLYYASRNSVALSVQSDEANGYFAGSARNPLKGIQYVPLSYNTNVADGDKIGRAVKLNLANAKFKDNEHTRVGADVKNTWFKDFNAMSDDATIIIEAGGAGQSYAIIRIIGAFNLSRQDDTCNIVIPKEDIDGVLSTELSATFNYSCSGTLGISLNVDNQFVGTTSNFLEAVKSTEFTHTKADQVLDGVLVRLDLVGSTFTGLNENTNYEEWFKDLEDSGNFQKPNANGTTRATSDGLAVTLEDGGNGKDYIVFNVKGAFKNEVPRITSNAIKIPSSNIIGSFKTDMLTNFYYRTKSSVSASFDTSSYYYGSATNRVSGTNQILIGGTEGVLLKINIEGGAFGKQITATDLNAWFGADNTATPTSILNGKIIKNDGDSTNFLSVIAGGGIGDDYVVIKLYGAFKRNTVSGSDIITIPSTVIQNMESTDNLEAVFNYVSNGNLTASIVGGSNLYGNSEDAPIETIIGYEFNNGSGYNVRIQLANGAVFKDMDESAKDDLFDELVTALDLKADNVKDYFNLGEPINGGAGFSYVEFKMNGVPGDNAEVDNTIMDDIKAKRGSIKLNFKGTHINNFVEDKTALDNNIEAELFYYNHPSSDVQVVFVKEKSGDNNAVFYGTQDKPIKAIPYTALGATGDGINLRMEVKFKDGVDSALTLRFAPTLNTATITKWFESFEYNADDINSTGYGHFAYQVLSGGPNSTFVEVKVTGYPTSTDGYHSTPISTHLTSLKEIAGLKTAQLDTVVYAKQLAPVRAEIMQKDDRVTGGRKEVSLVGYSYDAPIVGPMRLSTSGMYVGIKLTGGDADDPDYQPKFNGNVTNAILQSIFDGFIFPGYTTTLDCNVLYGADGFDYVIFEYNNSTPGAEVYETRDDGKPRGVRAGGPVYLPYSIIKNGVIEMDSVQDARASIPELYFMCIGSVTLSVITDAERLQIFNNTGVNIPLPIRRKQGTLTEGAKTNTNNVYYNVADATGMTNDETASRFSGYGKDSTNPLRIINTIYMYDQNAELKFYDESTDDGKNKNDNTDLEDGIDLELYLTNTTFHTSLSDNNVQTWFNTLYDSNDGSGDNLVISLNKNIDYQTTGNKLEDQNLRGVYIFQNPDTHLYNTILYLKVTGYMSGTDVKSPRSFSVNVPYTYIGNGKNELLGTVSIPEFWYERVNVGFNFTDNTNYQGGTARNPILGTQFVYLGNSYSTGVNVQGSFVNGKLTKAGGPKIEENFKAAFSSYVNIPHPTDADDAVPAYTDIDYEGFATYAEYGTKGQLTDIDKGLWYDGSGNHTNNVVTLSTVQGENSRTQVTFNVKGAPRFRTFTGALNAVSTPASITIPGGMVKGSSPSTSIVANLYWSIGRIELADSKTSSGTIESIFGFTRKRLTGNDAISTSGVTPYGNATFAPNSSISVLSYTTLGGNTYRVPEDDFRIVIDSSGRVSNVIFGKVRYYGYYTEGENDTRYYNRKSNPDYTVALLRDTDLPINNRTNAYVDIRITFNYALSYVRGIVPLDAIRNKNVIGNPFFYDTVRRFDNTYTWTVDPRGAEGTKESGWSTAGYTGVFWQHRKSANDYIHWYTMIINYSKFYQITGIDLTGAEVFKGYENADNSRYYRMGMSFPTAFVAEDNDLSKYGGNMAAGGTGYSTYEGYKKMPVTASGMVRIDNSSGDFANTIALDFKRTWAYLSHNTRILGADRNGFSVTHRYQNHGDRLNHGHRVQLILCSDDKSALCWNEWYADNDRANTPITAFSLSTPSFDYDDNSTTKATYNFSFPVIGGLGIEGSTGRQHTNKGWHIQTGKKQIGPLGGSTTRSLYERRIYRPTNRGAFASTRHNDTPWYQQHDHDDNNEFDPFYTAKLGVGTPACFYVPYSDIYSIVDPHNKEDVKYKITNPDYP